MKINCDGGVSTHNVVVRSLSRVVVFGAQPTSLIT
jgi:hypothetical protein